MAYQSRHYHGLGGAGPTRQPSRTLQTETVDSSRLNLNLPPSQNSTSTPFLCIGMSNQVAGKYSWYNPSISSVSPLSCRLDIPLLTVSGTFILVHALSSEHAFPILSRA